MYIDICDQMVNSVILLSVAQWFGSYNCMFILNICCGCESRLRSRSSGSVFLAVVQVSVRHLPGPADQEVLPDPAQCRGRGGRSQPCHHRPPGSGEAGWLTGHGSDVNTAQYQTRGWLLFVPVVCLIIQFTLRCNAVDDSL